MLLQHQLQQLALVIAHACRTVPFYRERFAAAGCCSGQPLTLAQLRALPLLTRRDIQDAGPALRSTAIPPQFGAVHENRTSGATGQPVQVSRTALDTLLWQANTLRDHHWHQRDQSLKLAAIRALAPGVADPPSGVTARRLGRGIGGCKHDRPVGAAEPRCGCCRASRLDQTARAGLSADLPQQSCRAARAFRAERVSACPPCARC